MSIRFAAARHGDCCVSRVLDRPPLRDAANDNGSAPRNDRMLRAALRHFAAHGLGAAEAARGNAETAFFAGDRQAYRWWLDICRMLDRRMAEAVAARRDVANQG
jgi:hypothetical protein